MNPAPILPAARREPTAKCVSTEVLQQVVDAMSWAVAICEMVPKCAHEIAGPMRDLGLMVNGSDIGTCGAAKIRRAAIALLDALKAVDPQPVRAVDIPADYVVAPLYPDDQMLDAAMACGPYASIEDRYRAMIGARPSVPYPQALPAPDTVIAELLTERAAEASTAPDVLIVSVARFAPQSADCNANK